MGDWRVKYDGVCSRCGVVLRAGDVAVYDRATRTIHCVSCPTAPAPEPPEIDAGVAGRSVRREHERRAAKRETEVKERWGDRIGGVVLALTDEPQSTRTWAVGARDEEKLAEALDGFSVLHDRRVPGTKGNIDHIVIAPEPELLFPVDLQAEPAASRKVFPGHRSRLKRHRNQAP